MAGIGFALAVSRADRSADIERTLVDASTAGMLDGDLRVLSILTSWLGVHHGYVHVARLRRVLSEVTDDRVRAYWAAVGSWLGADRRFGSLTRFAPNGCLDLLRAGTAFQIKRHGEDERFVDTPLRVPANVLRDRAEDVLTPRDLAARHRGYRNRVQLGANWRADVWTVLESSPDLTASEAARRAGSSFAVAWEVHRDFHVCG